MKKFAEPELEIVCLDPVDIICESVNYDKDYFQDRDDLIGWG